MKEYIILFKDIKPELISASSPKEALRFLAIDDLMISEKDWNNIYRKKSVIKIINILNNTLEEKNKICAIYRLNGFKVLADL